MWDWFNRLRVSTPVPVENQPLGDLKVPSGVVLIADAMSMDDPLRVDNLPQGTVPVVAEMACDGMGVWRVVRVILDFSSETVTLRKTVGHVVVDAASVVVIDEQIYRDHWIQKGPARVGVCCSPEHQKVAQLLKDRFGLDSRPVDTLRSELLTPVSPELEREIESVLKTIPRYAEHPFSFFRVETQNTADQIGDRLASKGLFGILELDPATGANLMAIQSGFGDGLYPVHAYFATGQLVRLEIEFIPPDPEETEDSIQDDPESP